MTRHRMTLVVSDFHLGAGPACPDGSANYLEDFFFDRKFIEFLNHYSSGDHEKEEVELVLNGDFFNHLQVWPDEVRPELMTERVALWRTEQIMDGHPELFEALCRFAHVPQHTVVFLVGNHDIGLLWPAVQHLLVKKLGTAVRVHVEPVYADGCMWIEHGNQHVAENRIDFDRAFLQDGSGPPIINMPWGDLFVIRFLNRVKKRRPYIDKVYPFKLYLRWAFLHDTLFALRAVVAGLVYFMAVLLRLGDNRRFSRQHFLKIIKEFSFPVKMDRAAKRIFALNPGFRIIVFGHGHQAASRRFGGGRQYFNTGIWNEMISLDLGTIGRQLRLTFVEISSVRGEPPQGVLKEWKGVYREVEEVGLV